MTRPLAPTAARVAFSHPNGSQVVEVVSDFPSADAAQSAAAALAGKVQHCPRIRGGAEGKRALTSVLRVSSTGPDRWTIRSTTALPTGRAESYSQLAVVAARVVLLTVLGPSPLDPAPLDRLIPVAISRARASRT